MHNSSSSFPRLAAPGAGLPKPELFFARLIFRFGRWRTNRGKTDALFASLRDEILTLAESWEDASAQRQILIPRLPGLEDSSRNWSLFMTLDHLRIVHLEISETIADLLAGRIPARPVSTAAVKPSVSADRSVVAAFAESCSRLEQTASGAPNLETALRHAHPWFGPLDAADWHSMSAFHLELHLKQIQAISRGLAARGQY